MTVFSRSWNVASLAVAAALLMGADVRAGEECCGGAKAPEAAAAKPDACCAGEEVAKKAESCDLGACDAKHAAALDGLLTPLTAAVPVLAPADAKAVAEAKATLMSCPAGRALTAALPTILEAVNALAAFDGAIAKQNGLPEECRTKDGWCAFCAEAGKEMPEAAGAAMKVSMTSLARAQKLAAALAPIAATFPLKGETTKPAGLALSAAEMAALAKKVGAAAQDLKAGMEAANKAPIDRKHLGAAVETLEKLVPAHSPNKLGPAHMAMYRELGLANDAIVAFGAAFPKALDAKYVAGLSANAQNAHKLIAARAHLVVALGAAYKAVCPGECADSSAKPAEAGCCEKSDGATPAAAKPSN